MTTTLDNPPDPGPGGPGGPDGGPGGPASPGNPDLPSSSADVVWAGPNAYLSGKARAILADGPDYAFSGGSAVTVDTGRSGDRVKAEWTESGTRRLIEFSARRARWTEWPYVYEAFMANNHEEGPNGRLLEWSRDLKSFQRYMIQIPDGYDLFRCDYVELNFNHWLQGHPGSVFTMDDFMVGFHLELGYSVGSLQVFEPCASVCSNGCECNLVDDHMTCGGSAVTYDDVYSAYETQGIINPAADGGATIADGAKAVESGAAEVYGGGVGTVVSAALAVLAMLLSRMGLA